MLTLTSSSTLDRSRYLRSQNNSGYIAIRLNATKATAPGAQLLTLTSSSALHRPRCLRSQTNSGYIAIRLEHHQGHSARSPVAHFDELICSAQAMLPQESDQLKLHRHSAGTPLKPQCQEPIAHFDELICSAQATLPQESDQLRLHCHSVTAPGAQRLTLTSSSTLNRPRSLRNQFNSCKSDDGRQPLKLTSSTKNRPHNLRNQFNSCKSDDGRQPLKLTSSFP